MLEKLALITALVIVVPGLAADCTLVVEGRPRAEIVLPPPDAPNPVLFAAQELQQYVKVMSGASMPIVARQTRKDVLPIMVTLNPQKGVGANLGPAFFPDRYRLQASDKQITIAGSTPRAALYGTYDLLERLGCGWCVPGDDSIPKRSTLSIPALEVDTAPAFQYRMMLDFPLMSTAQSIAIVDWLAKNRMSWVHPCPNALGDPQAWYERRDRVVPEIKKRGLQVIFGGHTMHTWLPPNRFQAHPEWFAYNNAQRQPPTLCVTNEAMTAELIRNLQRFLDRCPEVDVVDLWHPDSEVFCHCPFCTQGLVPADAKGKKPQGTPTAAVKSAYAISYIQFMNRVGTAIAKSHPRVMVSPLIYGPMDQPMPDGCPPLADNLLVGLAHIARDSYRPLAGEPLSAINLRYLGNDLTWMARSKHHYIYEYFNCWVPPYIYPGGQVIVQDLRLLNALGVQGASSDMYGYTPCNMYVAARALWLPNISWEAAVRDFHLRYYGAAGRDMADNEIKLAKGLYGKKGYGSGGALNPPQTRADSGKLLNDIRPQQIKFLEGLIARTSEPLVKARLQRALKPWKIWNADARWWAFPENEQKGGKIY